MLKCFALTYLKKKILKTDPRLFGQAYPMWWRGFILQSINDTPSMHNFNPLTCNGPRNIILAKCFHCKYVLYAASKPERNIKISIKNRSERRRRKRMEQMLDDKWIIYAITTGLLVKEDPFIAVVFCHNISLTSINTSAFSSWIRRLDLTSDHAT